MKEINEFDKVYIAKYIEIIGKRQVAEDIHISQEKVEDVIRNLKGSGLYDIYHDLSDEEWERIERSNNEEVLRKYLPQVINSKAVFEEIFEIFNVDLLETITRFPIYNQADFDFKFNYFQEQNYENEKWKRIENFKYSISNYGRIKNNKNNKLKALRFHRWILQVDLYEKGKRCTVCIPRLVADYFIKKVKKNERVIHRDGEYRNNYYKNLEIVKR